MNLIRWLADSTLGHDVRLATRRLRRKPLVTSVLVLSVGLGVGLAATAVAILSGVRRPLPVERANELVEIFESHARSCLPDCKELVTVRAAEELRSRMKMFAGFATARPSRQPTTLGDTAVMLNVAEVSEQFFSVLGVRPIAGRLLAGQIDYRSADRGVVISEAFWRRAFHRAPSAVGTPLRIGRAFFAVVGIAPAHLSYPAGADAWIPLDPPSTVAEYEAPQLRVVARLDRGVTMATARAQLAAWSVTRDPLVRSTPGPAVAVPIANPNSAIEPAVRLLVGGLLATLLVMGTNVVALLSLQVANRSSEVAVRLALGAGTKHIARTVLADIAMTVTAGLALATVVTLVGVRLANAVIEQQFGIDLGVGWPLRSFGVGAGFAIGAAAGAAAVHLLVLARLKPGDLLREGTTGVTGGPGLRALRQGLLVVQTGVLLVLFVAAGTLLRTFTRTYSADLRFDPSTTLSFHAVLDSTPRVSDNRFRLRGIIAGLQGLSGVKAVAVWSNVFAKAPGLPGDPRMMVEGHDELSLNQVAIAFMSVTTDFFRVFNLRLVGGRLLSDGDGLGTEPVAIVNEAAATMWWPGENPIGKHVRLRGPRQGLPWRRVIGVVSDGNVSNRAISFAMAAGMMFPYVYEPIAQTLPNRLVIGVAYDASSLPQSRDIVRTVLVAAPGALVEPPRNMRESLLEEGGFHQVLFYGKLFLALTVFVGILCTLGVWGLVAGSVNARRRELGIRIALGATRASVALLVARRSVSLSTLGFLLGVVVVRFPTRLSIRGLPGLQRPQLADLGLALVVLILLVGLASVVVARREIGADPVAVLRHGQ